MTCIYCNDDPTIKPNCYCRDATAPRQQHVDDPCDDATDWLWIQYFGRIQRRHPDEMRKLFLCDPWESTMDGRARDGHR